MLRGGVGRRGGWQITARMHGETMQVLGRFIAARAGAARAFVAGHGMACPCMLFPPIPPFLLVASAMADHGRSWGGIGRARTHNSERVQ